MLSPLIYLTGGPGKWLDRARGILLANGYVITDDIRRASLILVGTVLIDNLKDILPEFRQKAIVLSPWSLKNSLDRMRMVFKMGFYDIVEKPYNEQDLLKTVADAIAEAEVSLASRVEI